MKKFILPLLLLLAFGMLAAVESDPSAVVGYFKKTVDDGAFQAIALPFAYGDLSVNAVMGAQYLENDVVQDINTGFGTTFYEGFGFDGDLVEMEYGGGYYVNRAFGNGSGDYYLLGQVDPQAFTITILGNGGFTAFGLNEAIPVAVAVEDHPFGANPSDGDVIQEIDSGLAATFYEGYGWDGDLVELAPTFAYYYNSIAGSTSFSWTYTPAGGAKATKPVMSNRKVK